MRLRGGQILKWWAAAAGPLVVIAVAIAQLWPGLSEGLAPPITWDHGAHIGKAMLTARELLPALRGWTDKIELGIPLGVFYSPTATIWILLTRVFTFPLEWTQTYAVAIAAFRAVVGLSVFRLARCAGAGRVGATAAGVLALTDWGDHSEGGWFYDILYGVWPMSLAMSVFALGLADLLEYLDSGKRVNAVRSALLLGIALFSHPMSLLAVALTAPLVVVTSRFDGRAFGDTLKRAVPPLVIAGLIAAWWLLPVFSLTPWLDDHGQLYRTSGELGAALASGETLLNGGRWTNVLVAISLVVGVFGTGRVRVLAWLACISMFVSTSNWLMDFDATRWLPSLGRIMYPRFMMIAKPMCFALAGVLVHAIVAWSAPMLRTQLGTWRGRFATIVAVLLVAPFSMKVPEKLDELVIERSVVYTSTMPDWRAWNDVWEWVRSRPRGEAYRVAYFNDSTHLGQLSGAMTDRPAHVSGLLVAESFRNTSDALDAETLRTMNIRYIVSWGPSPLVGQTTQVARFGPATIYELRDWKRSEVTDPTGRAHPRVRNLERERVVIDPRGARSLVVHRALAPGWVAFADGTQIPLRAEPVRDHPRLKLMRAEVPPNTREIVVRYQGLGLVGVVGALASWLGIVLLLFLGGVRVPSRVIVLRERAIGRTPRFVRHHPFLLATVAVAALAVAFVLRARSSHHFAHDLESMRVEIRQRDGRVERCTQAPEKAPGRACASAPWVAVYRQQTLVDGRLHSCLAAHPPPSGDLVISWPHAPLHESLTFAGGIMDEAQSTGRGAPVDVSVRVDGRGIGSIKVPNGRAWIERAVPTPSGSHRLELVVHATEIDRRWLCVDAVAR